MNKALEVHAGRFVGRGPEMRQLSAIMSHVDEGTTEFVVVDGEAGIGTSRLLLEAAKMASGFGWAVVDARAIPSHLLSDEVTRLTSTMPTAIVVDDAGDLHDDYLDVLRTLGTQRRIPRLLIICALRFTTRESVLSLRRAATTSGGPTISLKPLLESGAAELATEILGRPLSPAELGLLSHARGVPLRIRQAFEAPSSPHVTGRALPKPLTPLIGRKPELAELTGLLRSERLITLAGPGGCGKTRLAQEMAQLLESDLDGGAVWVELAPRTDEPGVVSAVASALGVLELESTSIEGIITTLNRYSRVVVVLDNAEHLLAETGRLVHTLLTGAPGLIVLCTSREPLSIRGELIWRVPPLSAPKTGTAQPLSLESMAQFAAVQLFVERAGRVRRGFALTERNAPAVAQICERLDGLPLAIELAAARVRSMSPERIAAQLGVRIRSRSETRTSGERQGTIEDSIAWSEELLDDTERQVFRRLGVFTGGFTMEAAEAVVASAGDIDAYEIGDVITRLVDKSLLVFDEFQDRFIMLETIRSFALDRLTEYDEVTWLRDSHAKWYAQWLRILDDIAYANDAQQFIDQTPIWMRTISPDIANCHAAFEWVDTGGPTSLRLTAGLGYYWLLTAAYEEAIRFGLAAVLAGDTKSPEWGDAAMWLLGVLRNASMEAMTMLEKAAESGATLFSPRARLVLEGALMTNQLDFDGPTDAQLALFAETREHAYRERDWYTFTNCTYIPASVCAEYGFLRRADSMLGGFVNHRTKLVEALCATRRGELQLAQRHVASAAKTVEEDLSNVIVEVFEVAFVEAELELFRGGSGERLLHLRPAVTSVALGLYGNLSWVVQGMCHLFLGDLMQARASFEAGSGTAYQNYRLNAMLWLAQVEIALGRTQAAHASATALFTTCELVGPAFATTGHLVLAECLLQEQPGDALDRAHQALVVAADNELWVAAVNALEAIGTMLLNHGRAADGARLLAASQAERDRMGYQHRFAHRDAYVTTAHHSARSTLAWAEGTTLGLNEAIEFAQRTRSERTRPKTGWESLTPMEIQVADAVVRGLTNPQVAETLFISRSTVKTHLVHIFEKLGVRNRTELAALSRPARFDR